MESILPNDEGHFASHKASFVRQTTEKEALEIASLSRFAIQSSKKELFLLFNIAKFWLELLYQQTQAVAADDLEIGFERKIPLWLFGFLY
ncbi:MAG: hypothetical protein IPG32_00340 [Saprospirales bacterium]|nr:hypothetical protein [Saprospirales bacterium]